MKFTDTVAKKMLCRARLYEVEESLESYPEEERDGRADMQMLADEASYFLSLYGEDTRHREDLEWARTVLRETQYGKVVPMILPHFIPRYRPADVENAKSIVNEYNRLRSLVARLEKMGYYGKW